AYDAAREAKYAARASRRPGSLAAARPLHHLRLPRATRRLLPAARPPHRRGGRAAARRARRRPRAPLPLRRGSDDLARPLAPPLREHDRPRPGRLLGYRRDLPRARAVGPPLRRVRPDRAAPAGRRPRLGRGAVEP